MPSISEASGTCSSCIFFSSGTCHRYPPVPVAVDDGYGDATEIKSVWPEVAGEDFCGEHVSAAVPVPTEEVETPKET